MIPSIPAWSIWLVLALGSGFLALLASDPDAVQLVLEQVGDIAVVLGGSVALLAVVAGLVCYFEYHGIGSQEGIVRKGDSRVPAVAITFDDGPNPRYTPAVLDVLRQKGVKATFFLTGRHVEKYPHVVQRMVAEGHEIGNHTFTHRELVPSTRRKVLWELRRTERALRKVAGVRTNLFRPPRGIYSNAVRRILVEEGYSVVLWSVSSADWFGLSARQITGRVLRFARKGSIILFHDSGALVKPEGGRRAATVEALPRVIDGLRARGYEPVTVGELLALGQEKYLTPALEEA